MEKEKIVALAKTGSALVIGGAATAVVKKLVGSYLPVPENLLEKATYAVGTFGIGLVASQAVGKAVEAEVDDLAGMADVISSMVQTKEVEEA